MSCTFTILVNVNWLQNRSCTSPFLRAYQTRVRRRSNMCRRLNPEKRLRPLPQLLPIQRRRGRFRLSLPVHPLQPLELFPFLLLRFRRLLHQSGQAPLPQRLPLPLHQIHSRINRTRWKECLPRHRRASGNFSQLSKLMAELALRYPIIQSLPRIKSL